MANTIVLTYLLSISFQVRVSTFDDMSDAICVLQDSQFYHDLKNISHSFAFMYIIDTCMMYTKKLIGSVMSRFSPLANYTTSSVSIFERHGLCAKKQKAFKGFFHLKILTLSSNTICAYEECIR